MKTGPGSRGGSRGAPRPSGRFTREGPPPRTSLDDRAAEIARSTGLPVDAARRVALGQADVSDLVAKLAFRAQVDALMARHGLIRALATQVVLGQAGLDAILQRRRVDAHLDAHRDRTVLDEARASGAEITLGLHGQRNLRARITAVERYEITVVDSDTGDVHPVHKLQLKYAYATDDHKRVKKALDYDKVRRDRGAVEPLPRPQDRYACSDRRLGQLLDARVPVVATTLEGERFAGEIAWISRFEFGLRTKAGGEVTLFRHALDLLEEPAASKPHAARPVQRG